MAHDALSDKSLFVQTLSRGELLIMSGDKKKNKTGKDTEMSQQINCVAKYSEKLKALSVHSNWYGNRNQIGLGLTCSQ